VSTSTAPFLRHPSSDRHGTQLQHEDAQALISAVLNLSQARGLVVGSPPPPYFTPLPRPAVRYARLALGAALLLAFGGLSYWMGSSFHKPSGEPPEGLSTLGAAAAAAAPAAQSVDPALIQAVMQALAQQSAAAPTKAEPAKSAPPQKPLAKQATTPRPVASVKVAATPAPPQAQQAPAPKPAPRTQAAAPSPAPAPQRTAGSKPVAGAPAAIAGVPTFAATAPTPASDDAPARQREDGNGVSVDLGAVGSATATPQRPAARRSSSPPATPIQASAPATPAAPATLASPAEPAQAPAPRIAAADFSVVGVLDGMVLVQQGRRVSPVAIGQTLPDGKVLRSTDAESGKFEAGRL